MNNERLENVRLKLQAQLMAEFEQRGYWEGHLSSSALSTAVASYALSLTDHTDNTKEGLDWIVTKQNADGGWGDTVESPSNLSTTLLSVAALKNEPSYSEAFRLGMSWVFGYTKADNLSDVRKAVLQFYAADKTFSVPILMLCTAAGLFGESGQKAWCAVPQLPYELSVVPQRFFPLLNLRVVSYALPALIGIGLVRHRKAEQKRCPLYFLREAITPAALRKLQSIQPESGGFLEAAPLTGFVLTALIHAGYGDHPVAQACKHFLVQTQRSDGSWPIDTDLSNWVTSLAISSLGAEAFSSRQQKQLRSLLLEQQTKTTHPYTGAASGGWAWTQRSGGVPDGDDTAAALKALWHLRMSDPAETKAAESGVQWLLGMQNSDGGIPTFCKGWGRLPFDASCPDITAHVLHAWSLWYDELSPATRRKLDHAAIGAIRFLEKSQCSDGSWIPLWFGNQKTPGQKNPVFGTAQVVRSLAQLRLQWQRTLLVEKAAGYLLEVQHPEGGWGGASGVEPTIEETALALAALNAVNNDEHSDATTKAKNFLISQIEKTDRLPSAPIGLYFASLWYDERLYPAIFSCEALR